MSWADLLKSIVCVLNLIACVRLTGPYLIPKRSDREWSEARRRTDLYCRLAGWIGVFARMAGACSLFPVRYQQGVMWVI